MKKNVEFKKLNQADVIKTHGSNSLILKFIKKENFFFTHWFI